MWWNKPPPQGYINIDKYPTNYTDKIVDLDKLPLPFEDNSIEEIECLNILEHLLYPVDTLKDFHRILKKDGIVKIRLSFYNHPRSYEDLTHLHFTGYNVMDVTINRYLNDKYKIIDKKILYSRFALIHWKWLGHLIPNYVLFIDWTLKKL